VSVHGGKFPNTSSIQQLYDQKYLTETSRMALAKQIPHQFNHKANMVRVDCTYIIKFMKEKYFS
jgi:hypothetical protein